MEYGGRDINDDMFMGAEMIFFGKDEVTMVCSGAYGATKTWVKKDITGSTTCYCQIKQYPTSQGCQSWQQHSTNVDTVKPFDGNKLIYQTRNGYNHFCHNYDKNGHCCLLKIAACYPF